MNDPGRRHFLAISAGLALSRHLAGADAPAALTLLLFGGELPEVRKALQKDYHVKLLTAGATRKRGEKTDTVTGLERLKDADVFVGSVQKRVRPSKEQLAHFQAFHKEGKPVVGYRACSHVFQNWLQIDREVFGAKYGGHHLGGKEKKLIVEPAKNVKDHPILKGLTPPPPVSGSYVYTDLAGDVQVLLYSGLPGDLQPHTWVRQYKKTGGRVFYTRYDARDFATNDVCRTIFLRGLAWALDGKLDRHRRKE